MIEYSNEITEEDVITIEYPNKITEEEQLDNFRANLKTMRERCGLSKIELGKELGLGRDTIANYEKGISYPNLFILIKLTEILDTSINDLLGFPCEIPTIPDNEIEHFSSKTGLSEDVIRTLYNNKIDEKYQKDVEALNYLIRYNDNTNDNVSVLRCLYQAIRLPAYSISEVFRKKLLDEDYYSNDNIFLKSFLKTGEHVHMGDIYLLLFYKKIDFIVKKKIWKNLKARKKREKRETIKQPENN